MRILRFAGRGIERMTLKIFCIKLLAATLGQTDFNLRGDYNTFFGL